MDLRKIKNESQERKEEGEGSTDVLGKQFGAFYRHEVDPWNVGDGIGNHCFSTSRGSEE